MYDAVMPLSPFRFNTTYYIKIQAVTSDGVKDVTNVFAFERASDFPFPRTIGSNYAITDLSWEPVDYGELTLRDYSIEINGEKYSAVDNTFSIPDPQDVLYQVRVRANYESGSSMWSDIFYVNLTEITVLDVYYDVSSDAIPTFELPVEDDIIYVVGEYLLVDRVLPDSIALITGNSFQLNPYYIYKPEEPLPYVNDILLDLTVATANEQFKIYIRHGDMS